MPFPRRAASPGTRRERSTLLYGGAATVTILLPVIAALATRALVTAADQGLAGGTEPTEERGRMRTWLARGAREPLSLACLAAGLAAGPAAALPARFAGPGGRIAFSPGRSRSRSGPFPAMPGIRFLF